jgi:serine phosphatase RsbU (regulator of sigma subunit)
VRLAFKLNTITRLSLVFGLFWLALAGAAVFGWRRVSTEVGDRAQAEAGFAVATISQRVDEYAALFGPQGRDETAALRSSAAREGRARLVSGPDGPTLSFGRISGPLAEKVASDAGGVATVFAYRDKDLSPVDSSRENAGGALGEGAAVSAATGLPQLVGSGRPGGGPIRLAGRAYYTWLEPIRDASGAVVGAFGASFPLETIDDVSRELAHSPVFANGFLVIADARDNVLYSASEIVPPWVAAHLREVNQGGDLQGGTLAGYIVTRSAPGKSGLRVIAGVSQSDLTFSTLKLAGASLSVLVMVVVVAMCLAWLLARRLTDAVALAERHEAEAEQARAAAEAADAALNLELEQAARYVESLLPERTQHGPVAADWLYRPSERLGGDAFGYHWLDAEETHFAFYLLDVCGHGVGAALLATTAMNVIRSQTVMADFADPSSVLFALNEAFPMDHQNGMYFTIWYGVYDTASQRVRYAGGGHHPAVLIAPAEAPILLQGKAPPIGCFEHVKYPSWDAPVAPGSQLYIFSDGLFEVELKSGPQMLTFDEFVEIIVKWREGGDERELAKVLEVLQGIQGKPNFDDDCSLVELSFRSAGKVRLVA